MRVCRVGIIYIYNYKYDLKYTIFYFFLSILYNNQTIKSKMWEEKEKKPIKNNHHDSKVSLISFQSVISKRLSAVQNL